MNILNDVWTYFLGCPDCWAGIIAIVLLLIVWIAYRKTQRMVIVHNSDMGKVRVSTGALVGLVKEACTRVGISHCSDVSFQQNNGKFDLDLKVRVGLDQNITDLLRNLSHFISIAIGRVLGPDYVGKINLNVVGFKGDVKQIPVPSICDLENKVEEFKFIAKKEGMEEEKKF